MNAAARLFAFTLTLTLLGSSSACLTTLCLNAMCGTQAAAPPTAASGAPVGPSAREPRGPAIGPRAVARAAAAERRHHNCELMRF
jgi:hypothetical protein